MPDMIDAHERTPTTFWEDRLHFASGPISEWFRPTLKELFTNSLQLALTAFFAILFFGAASFSGHAEAYLAAAAGTIVVFLFKWLAGMVLFFYYYIKAPPAMWRRDQTRIADLEARFIPSLRLEFSEEDCRARLRVGEVHPSAGGKRWIRIEGTPEHVLVRCVNGSEVRIEGIETYAALLHFTPPGQDTVAPQRFLDPVRVKSPFDEVDTISLPARGTRHVVFWCGLRTTIRRGSMAMRGPWPTSASLTSRALMRSASKRTDRTCPPRRSSW
jgi:hypothetical protein